MIDIELTQYVEWMENYRKSVLKRVVNVIGFIAERELAFGGGNWLICQKWKRSLYSLNSSPSKMTRAQHIET